MTRIHPELFTAIRHATRLVNLRPDVPICRKHRRKVIYWLASYSDHITRVIRSNQLQRLTFDYYLCLRTGERFEFLLDTTEEPYGEDDYNGTTYAHLDVYDDHGVQPMSVIVHSDEEGKYWWYE